MAGSYAHIVNEQGQFVGTRFIENLGDAYEALEECYGMIWQLADGDVAKVEEARLLHGAGLALSPGIAEEDDDDDE